MGGERSGDPTWAQATFEDAPGALSSAPMRAPVPAVLAALVVAALGAVILGEYELAGTRPLLAGVLFGVAVAEVIASVARTTDGDVRLLAAAALVTEAGLVWATWISTGHELDLASGTAWAGIVLGSGASPLWLRSAGRRGGRTPDGTTPAPVG